VALNLRSKVILLAIIPSMLLAAVISGITFMVLQKLATEEVEQTRTLLTDERKLSLKHYLEIAQAAIQPIYDASKPGDTEARDQRGAVFKVHFAADDHWQPGFSRSLPGPHDPGQGAFIGDRQRLIAVTLGPLEQFLGAGGTALKAEVRQAVQLDVFRRHANQPCSHKPSSLPTV
jgi:hypothetical protein